MASENESGSSKHRTNDDQDNSSHYSHSSSSSYASSVSLSSKSNSLESDVDEKDQLSPTKSENENLKSSPAEWSMLSVSPRAGYSPSEMSQNSVSSTLPPPVQTMGRVPGYDPNRIPSSVFGNSKPAGNMEWSVASNESLFSIQMGNNSFTRDQFNLLKSGELKSPDDQFMKSMSGLPPITETSTNETSTNELHGLPVVNEAASENVTGRESIECEEVKEIKNNETVMTADKIRLSVSTSNVSENQGMPHTPARASDGSRMSNGSFAFPVLGGETPSRSSVKKPIIQQQQQQQQEQKQQQEAPEEPQKQAETNKWVACFSCCPFCK